ncbi:SgcJ/EcaC family oxidoreductase [Saccharomonospora xinjiangensis]|uniref:SgcJ/EcaC family oxidoreductase n=1 Tax=Saccharomonospora xinjiangensis TaxID=75294 RepID=UPI00350FE1E3
MTHGEAGEIAEAEVRSLFDRMCEAWTSGDADAYGELFTEDSDYVSFDGTRATGRAPMVESHDRLFRGVLAGTALVGKVESVRFLSDDVALVHGTGSVLVAWRSTLPKRRLTRNTIVCVRTPVGWRIAAIHNGRVRPLTIPSPDSVPARMARTLVRLARALGLGRAAGVRA